MAVSSCSMVDLFFSPLVKFLLAYAIGSSMSPCFCVSTAPLAILEASVYKINFCVKSGNFRMTGDNNFCLSVSNAFWHSVVHSNLAFFFNRLFKGAAMSEKYGMNRR